MNKSCPECHRSIAVKIIDTCLYCGVKLPKELCLSEEEKNEIKQQRAKERKDKAARDSLWNFGGGSMGGDSDFGGDSGGE